MVDKIVIAYNRIKDVEKELELNGIDLIVQEKFQEIVREKYPKKNTTQYFHKLQAFALLTNFKLNNISLYNKNHSSFFSNFVCFTKNNGFGFDTRNNNLNIRITQYLVSELNIELIQKINLAVEPNIKINADYLKYFQGWFYEHKSLRSKNYINLYKYVEIFGLEEANKIESIIQSIQNFRTDIEIFNSFILYLAADKRSIFINLDKELLHDFMRKFFQVVVERNRCLNSAKRVWNILIRTLQEYFNLDKTIKLSLTREHKNPNEMNLKSIDGKLVKNKLITHIPLEISDDKSLYLIKDKINQDLNLIKDWAISSLKDFDKNTDPSNFVSRKELYSIFVLLTLEHPSIRGEMVGVSVKLALLGLNAPLLPNADLICLGLKAMLIVRIFS